MEQQAVGPRTAPLAPGSVFGGWQVVRRLGGGGMAEIYLAQHPRIPRLDVLKVMRSWLADDERFRERFHAEAERISSLSHPNVITIYDQGEDNGRLYLVMQHAPGGDLRGVLEQEGRLSAPRALEIATQLAGALDAGHEIGLVHRDVKPDNVLLDAPRTGHPDRVLLCDFGISTMLHSSMHLTRTGELLVSPNYAAPEQFEEKAIDGRTDQYSLACLLYELLAGAPPFSAPTLASAYKAHCLDPVPGLPPELGLSPGLDAALRRALSKRSEDRFESCGAFLKAATAEGAAKAGASENRAAIAGVVPPPPRKAPDSTPTPAEKDPPTAALPATPWIRTPTRPTGDVPSTKAANEPFASAPYVSPSRYVPSAPYVSPSRDVPSAPYVSPARSVSPAPFVSPGAPEPWPEPWPEPDRPSRTALLETVALTVIALGLVLASLLSWFTASSRADPVTPWDAFSLRYFVGGGPSSYQIDALGDQRLGPYVLVVAVLLFGAAVWRRGPQWGAFLAFLVGAGCAWSIALFVTDDDPASSADPGLWLAAGLCAAYVIAGLSVSAARRRRYRAETVAGFGPG